MAVRATSVKLKRAQRSWQKAPCPLPFLLSPLGLSGQGLPCENGWVELSPFYELGPGKADRTPCPHQPEGGCSGVYTEGAWFLCCPGPLGLPWRLLCPWQDAHELFHVITSSLEDERDRQPRVTHLFDVRSLEVSHDISCGSCRSNRCRDHRCNLWTI